MCGIAGLIHRGKSSNVGSELQLMLQALKHRGPDSTGYALYAENDGKNFIMRFKVGENVGEGSTSVNEDASDTIIDLSGYVTNIEDLPLTYSVVSVLDATFENSSYIEAILF